MNKLKKTIAASKTMREKKTKIFNKTITEKTKTEEG